MSNPLVLPLDVEQPDPAVIARAARVLAEGEIVAAPTDTVYGLLALARSREARDRLGVAKERAAPYIVLVGGWEEARSWTRGVAEETWRRLAKVWPGPVTALLPTAPDMPGAVAGKIGLRMPRSPFLTRLLAEVGEPLFSTSANRRGRPPAGDAREVAREFPEGLALILDGGPASSGLPSTIVDLAVDPPRLVRTGRGDAAALLDRPSAPS